MKWTVILTALLLAACSSAIEDKQVYYDNMDGIHFKIGQASIRTSCSYCENPIEIGSYMSEVSASIIVKRFCMECTKDRIYTLDGKVHNAIRFIEK
jgi:nitrate/TMAO reductase-like tetraheme cytochrome c subunit